MRGVMAASRRPQVELSTECLKCAVRRPGGLSPGLEVCLFVFFHAFNRIIDF